MKIIRKNVIALVLQLGSALILGCGSETARSVQRSQTSVCFKVYCVVLFLSSSAAPWGQNNSHNLISRSVLTLTPPSYESIFVKLKKQKIKPKDKILQSQVL